LHRLNNVDKHRVLITAGSAYRSVNIGAHISRKAQELLASSPLGATKLSEMDVGADWPSLNIYLKPADRLFPLKQGDELFMDEPDAEPIEKLQFLFEVAFGEPGVVFGEPILESVASMLAQVEGIPPQFESDLA
jgi:hypothetical protein